MGVNSIPTEIPEALTLISDTLAVTGDELVVIVVVVVESVNNGAVLVAVICGCKTPTDIGGHGAIGVVDEGGGEGGAKSWKSLSVIGTEVGIEKVTTGFRVIGSETIGCEVAALSSCPCWTYSGLRMSEMVLDCESPSTLGVGMSFLRVVCFFFFGVCASSEGPTFVFLFPHFFGLSASTRTCRTAAVNGRGPEVGLLR